MDIVRDAGGTSLARYDIDNCDGTATYAYAGATMWYVANGELISFVRNAQSYNVIGDRMGHVRMVLDSSGDTVCRFDYDAWGGLLGSSFDNLPGGMPYRYVGMFGVRWDDGVGMYYMRQRWYDAGLQRFVSRDVLRGSNRYAYAWNSPAKYIDRSGKAPVDASSIDLTKPRVIEGVTVYGLQEIENEYKPNIGQTLSNIGAALRLVRDSQICGGAIWQGLVSGKLKLRLSFTRGNMYSNGVLYLDPGRAVLSPIAFADQIVHEGGHALYPYGADDSQDPQVFRRSEWAARKVEGRFLRWAVEQEVFGAQDELQAWRDLPAVDYRHPYGLEKPPGWVPCSCRGGLSSI